MKLVIKREEMSRYFDGDELKEEYDNVTDLTITGLQRRDYFLLRQNKTLKKISLPDMVEIGNCFLKENEILTEISLPNVVKIGSFFLSNNTALSKISLPKVRNIDSYFLSENKIIHTVDMPNLETVGESFLRNNEGVINLYLPKLTEVGENFLYYNHDIKRLYAPLLVEKGEGFLSHSDFYGPLNREIEPDIRGAITSEIIDEIKIIYDNFNELRDRLIIFERDLKKLKNDFGISGSNKRLYFRYKDSCESFNFYFSNFIVEEFLFKHTRLFDNLLKFFNDKFEYNVTVVDLIWNIRKPVDIDPGIFKDIEYSLNQMSEAIDVDRGFKAYGIFEHSYKKMQDYILKLRIFVALSIFHTVRFAYLLFGISDANKNLKRTIENIYTDILEYVHVDERLLSLISPVIEASSSEKYSMDELEQMETNVFVQYLENKKSDFYSYDPLEIKNEPIKICDYCGEILDDDGWCGKCREFSNTQSTSESLADVEINDSLDNDNTPEDEFVVRLCADCMNLVDDDGWCSQCQEYKGDDETLKF